MPIPKKTQRMVLAGAVTAITIAGSLYGAGLKTNQEVAQTAQKTREITLDERIADLRQTRQNLMLKRELVEKQIRDLDMRVEDRKQKGIGGQSK
ncbi:uncharacterized protein ASPGLDRAFT_34822 [Aspergillus glaucus CBS 516.65]|uniref:HIG1 domain-containing protein n=1 Tax=Aspergillus glaucus CBS 516.65 TaxID=1160497 RepID=A0A1L9VMN0_ASPGL|nr:hypothetical protein ASPGLDRAFT_34822 [Aspergillus glaucus CBS 516.65]OJJ85187.1 hypothetical protein ASPGLDRAFT_34822 [Aspergillus glaucus CBS 516.65]